MAAGGAYDPETIGVGRVLKPSWLPHFGFGTALPLEHAFEPFWVTRAFPGAQSGLFARRHTGVTWTEDLKYGSGTVDVFPTGDYLGAPYWEFDDQWPRGSDPWCEVIPAPPRCTSYYSSTECVTAYWRIQDDIDWLQSLGLGAGDVLAGTQFSLRCNVHQDEDDRFAPVGSWAGYYKIRVSGNKLLLAPFRTTSLAAYAAIDHEYGHHVMYRLLKSAGGTEVCCGVAFDDDDGQSEAMDEVIPDILAECHNGTHPGVYYSLYGAAVRYYPGHGLWHSGCSPTGSAMPAVVPCATDADCDPWLDGCASDRGVCSYRCRWIHNGHVENDGYNFVGESGEHDGHSGNNGRVLYQALIDYRERFGSAAFDSSLGYAGPIVRAWEIRPSGIVETRRNHGPSHDLDPSGGAVSCGPIAGEMSQVATLSEFGAGTMSVIWSSISLPEGATMTIDSADGFAPPVVYAGPLEYGRGSLEAALGLLYSPAVLGRSIRIVASGPAPGGSCDADDPFFTIIGWAHTGGDMGAGRIVGGAWGTCAWCDWPDLYANVMGRDRRFADDVGTDFTHQGSYFANAFERRGINDRLDDYCDENPCECHDNWWCP